MESCSRIVDGIQRESFIVIPDFLPPVELAALNQDFESKKGLFRAAGIGLNRDQNSTVRGDQILWLEAATAEGAQARLWNSIEQMRVELNQQLFLGLDHFEGHYAFYPPGAAYKRHLDRLRANSDRILSFILYLNPSWQANDGGELLLYLKKQTRTVQPRGGTLVCFLSAEIEHEVLLSRVERRSVTGWFRRRSGYL